MRAILACMLLVACGGPGQTKLAETPTARTPRSPTLAPPASDNDEERYQLNQQFDDMRAGQRAREEANQTSPAPPPPPPGQGPPGAPPAPAPAPVKKGPAEQAPAPPRK